MAQQKELRRMRRTELIEIIYALKQSETTLEAQKAALEAQLAERTLRLEQAGSIAEAALSLNHVFEAAQQAADDYLVSAEAAKAEAEKLLEETRQQCEAMRRDAENDVAAKWDAFNKKAKEMLDEYNETGVIPLERSTE